VLTTLAAVLLAARAAAEPREEWLKRWLMP
jgi:hypothetical protein